MIQISKTLDLINLLKLKLQKLNREKAMIV